MRKSLAVILCVLGCLTQIAVAQRAPKRAPKKEPGPAAPEPVVKRTVEMLTEAWAANNADGVRKVCADEVVRTELGRRLRSLQAVLDYMEFNFKNFPSMQIQLGPIEARVAGTMAWAHADTRMRLATTHSLKLNYAGYSSYVLERRREGWKIVLIDFDLQPVEQSAGENPTPSSPRLESTWMLESSKNLGTGQVRQPAATLVFTKSHFCLLSAAPDRRQPNGKRVSDYTRKELQELMRELDASTGTYRVDGSKVILLSGLALLPGQAGEEMTLDNVKVTPDRLSYEIDTPDGRFQRVWRRIE
jgi:ketosteroid isomerase-like protein